MESYSHNNEFNISFFAGFSGPFQPNLICTNSKTELRLSIDMLIDNQIIKLSILKNTSTICYLFWFFSIAMLPTLLLYWKTHSNYCERNWRRFCLFQKVNQNNAFKEWKKHIWTPRRMPSKRRSSSIKLLKQLTKLSTRSITNTYFGLIFLNSLKSLL